MRQWRREAVPKLITSFAQPGWVRLTEAVHPDALGMGYGKTRWASATQSFKVLYIASQVVTGVAETIVRDRFEGRVKRNLAIEKIREWSVVDIEVALPLRLLDLRDLGATHLGLCNLARTIKLRDATCCVGLSSVLANGAEQV